MALSVPLRGSRRESPVAQFWVVRPHYVLRNRMSEQTEELRLEGIVRASHRDPGGQGKQFLGAAIECSDGTVWVVTYEEDSQFHTFADRHVVVFGKSYKPTGQHLLGWHGANKLGHFCVTSIRLAEGT